MENFLLLSLLFPVAFAQNITYSITKKWNGDAIDHDPATIIFTSYLEGNELDVEASALFFNSPVYDIDLLTSAPCPRRSVEELDDYEVPDISLCFHN